MSLSASQYESKLWLASNVSTRLAPHAIRPTDASIKLTENCQAQCVTCDYGKPTTLTTSTPLPRSG